MKTNTMICSDCHRWTSECRCKGSTVWHVLANLPTPYQWLIVIGGYMLVGMLIAFALMSSASAQAAVPRTSAELSFTPPAKNTDGTDVAASCPSGVTLCGKLSLHRIEYGTCSSGAFGTKQGEISVAMPATTAIVANLVVQVYCFRVIARNDYGAESAPSNVATKTIAPPTPGAPVLSVVSSTAYEIRPNARGVLVAHRVGVVPRGVPCEEQHVTVADIEYHRVARGNLDLVNWPASDPLTEVWAECGAAGSAGG